MSFIPKRALAALVATAVTGVLAAPATAAEEKKINIGWTAWSDAEAVTKLAAKLMEDRLGYDVELTLADIGPQYQGVENGDLDLMMMSWLPDTHGDYYKKAAGKIIDLGPIYTGAKLGWVVPNYIPEDQLKSLADLKKPEVAEKLDSKIQGIDPGAGLMRLSDEAIKTYGLDYELVSASGAAMTAALDRAIKRDEWIVVTGWSPHWMFGAYDLRYLDDPEGALGGAERVHAIARMGLDREQPEAFGFLSRFNIPLAELEALMAEANETSYEAAVDNYIENHPARVEYWVTGKIG
ncbi:glycine/betaine ABC transporter substrate-binding protein [Tistrella bauzanensis]|uniref:Glycine/betaine ABC transporter substrate-binding protein n=1 Tax=Tistrella bauzanensis TaxID=657419 RepID=A0ABQ1IAP9_9PROT|nr:glycine betaine ABC transporter substrate-binding protein [Tistrella bauzanensis]GGB29011.1 glycine/betaine ABC transporter substrate-binding protein [Tistrella bauzanensis]